MNLENYSANVCTEFNWNKRGKMVDFGEHDEKASDSIKASNFFTS
jgi:hypothetical protein